MPAPDLLTVSKTPTSNLWAILPHLVGPVSHAALPTASEEELRIIAAVIGAPARPAAPTTVNSVSVLPVFGVILPHPTLMTAYGAGTAASQLGRQVRAAMADPSVGAIVLDINSPGGSVQGVDELARVIFDARGTKPIVAVANHLAASAAYWIASAADEVVATPSSETGSIGVFVAHEDISGAMRQAGIRTTLISAGRNKTEANPYEPLSSEARAYIQSRVNDYYSAFVNAVARGRGVSAARVRDGFGQGRAVGAREALQLRMVDRIATLDETLKRLGRSKTSAPQGQASSYAASAELAWRRARAAAIGGRS